MSRNSSGCEERGNTRDNKAYLPGVGAEPSWREALLNLAAQTLLPVVMFSHSIPSFFRAYPTSRR